MSELMLLIECIVFSLRKPVQEKSKFANKFNWLYLRNSRRSVIKSQCDKNPNLHNHTYLLRSCTIDQRFIGWFFRQSISRLPMWFIKVYYLVTMVIESMATMLSAALPRSASNTSCKNNKYNIINTILLQY